MSRAQDFLDKLQTGRIETKEADESMDVWTKLQAILENGARRLAEEEQQIENANVPTPEQLEKYATTIDKIFNVKHFGKLVAPSIRNSIRKALKEQLPNLDYKNADFHQEI